MARPKKDSQLLMNIPLRIMLTLDQRELIEQAAKTDGMDMTAWARPILLQAARARVERPPEQTRKRSRTAGPNTK